MPLSKEIQKLLKMIPKDHHKIVHRIIKLSHEQGVKDTLALVRELSEIPTDDINSYIVIHEDNIDGG